MGRDYFQSLSFRFRTERSFLDAVSNTQRRRPADAIAKSQPPIQSVPEPISGVGLLAVGVLGTGSTLIRKKASSID